MLNPTQLGVFTVGSEIATLPETELDRPAEPGLFRRFRRGSTFGTGCRRRPICASPLPCWSLPCQPASASRAIAAPLVYIGFGAKWLEATPVIEILAISGVFAVIERISSSLFYAFGYLRPMFWTIVALSLVQFALLVPFVWHSGIVGAAIACTLTAFCSADCSVHPRVPQVCDAAAGPAVAGLALPARSRGDVRVPGPLRPRLDDARSRARSAACGSSSSTSGLGATVYTGALLCLWLASGKPNGPEADLLELIKRITTRLLRIRQPPSRALRAAGSLTRRQDVSRSRRRCSDTSRNSRCNPAYRTGDTDRRNCRIS